jgi:transposase
MKPVPDPDDGVRRVITAEMWHRLAPLLRKILNPRGRPPELAVREFLEAVFFWARTGVGWRDLPPCFGNWDAVYGRWRRWEDRDVWKKLWQALGKDAAAASERLLVDSTIVRAHQHAAGAAVADAARQTGRSRGGVGTKVHVVACDAKTALAVTITPGQAHDAPAFEPTMLELPEETAATAVIADRGYDSDAIRDGLEDAEFEVVIPARKNRKEPRPHDAAKYKLRNEAERLINRLKRLRRLATRYEKLGSVFLAVIHVGCILSIIA